MSWRKLKVLVEQLPSESRLVRAVNPAAEWGPKEHLLAGIFDVLQLANWQRSGRGSRPKPLPRPGKKDRRLGTARPLSETRDLFERWRTGRLHAPVERERSHIHTRKGEVRHARH